MIGSVLAGTGQITAGLAARRKVAATWTPATATTSGGVSPGAWFKADALVLNDADAVATWADSSGNSRDATEATNRPIYKTGIVNSLPVVRFDGTNDKLALTNSIALLRNLPGASIFIVHRPTSDALTSNRPVFYVASNATTKTLLQLWLSSDSYGVIGRRVNGDSSVGITGGVTASIFAIHEAVVDWANNDLYLYANGVQLAANTSFQGAGNSDNIDHNNAPVIGNARDVLWYKGDIAEILIYRSALSTADRQQVEGYLSSKYAIPTARPAAAYPGNWSWFTNPRALYYNGKTYVGLVTTTGDVTIHSLADTTYAGNSGLLKDVMQVDDHDDPSLLIRDSDKRILAWYCPHSGASVYQRISTNPEDVTSWGAEVNLDSVLGLDAYSYPNPVQLTGETNDPIYLFFRCVSPTPDGIYYSVSTDGGVTWAAGQRFIVNTGERPYFHAIRNGDSRVDFVISDGHPVEVSTNSLYHCYFTGGNLYKSDGTLIGAIGSGPYTPSTQLTRIYNGATDHAWNWDIVLDGSGYPVVVYAKFPTDADHRYCYARWSGSAWSNTEIVAAGTYLYVAELYYSGGICIDPDDPNIVYLSKQVSSQWEIWKYTTADNGATWDAGVAITTGSSVKNIRPFVPRGGGPLDVLWVKGTYTSYTSYSMTLESSPSYY